MLKIAAAAASVLFIAASPFAYAQAPSPSPSSPSATSPSATSPSARASDRLNAADLNTLTDMRIDILKAALQLTPEQTKYWPAIESAMRARAQSRQARIEKVTETVGAKADESPIELLRNRDPVAFLQRRADALAQRSADLKKLADAWQPLYPTLSREQKQRLAGLTIFVVREMGDAIEQRRANLDDED
jgi:hypothetical protein